MLQLLKLIFLPFEKIEKRGVPVVVSSVLILGVLPFLALIILFADYLPIFSPLPSCLVFIWFMFSRYFIYKGWKRLQSSFNEFKELFVDVDEFRKQYDRACNDFYGNKILLVSLPFVLGACYIINEYAYEASFGLHVWLTIVMTLLFLFAGVGLWNGFNIYIYVINLLKRDLHINPLYPDEFGGLEPVGAFIINTSLLISTGSLVIPFAIMISSTSSFSVASRFISLGLTVIYILIILFSFISPLLKLSDVAKRYKYSLVGEAVIKYNDFLIDMLKNPSSENQAKLNLYYNTYLIEIKKMKILPFTGRTTIQIFGALALPSVTFILQLLAIL